MLKLIIITTISLSSLLSNASHAKDMLIDGNIFYTVPDAGGTDDFHTGKILNFNYSYYYRPWLALTAGIFFSEEIYDEVQTDIVGTYQASVETRGLSLGIRPEYSLSEQNKIYARLGIISYKTKLIIDEYFEPGLPTGSSDSTTTGNGYLISFGWQHSFTNEISFQLELKNQKQLDLFDGKTSPDRVFDFSYTGFSIGLGYAF